ncbi:MAG: hypothetical protein LBU32_03770 [Clostridiales bacterium]|jgi:hypothetical protein|nr:hypothetical protein [Clostridiales bacterium]
MLGTGTDGRPEVGDARREFGHWDIDSAAVLTIIERTARNQTAVMKLDARGSGAVDAACGGDRRVNIGLQCSARIQQNLANSKGALSSLPNRPRNLPAATERLQSAGRALIVAKSAV